MSHAGITTAAKIEAFSAAGSVRSNCCNLDTRAPSSTVRFHEQGDASAQKPDGHVFRRATNGSVPGWTLHDAEFREQLVSEGVAAVRKLIVLDRYNTSARLFKKEKSKTFKENSKAQCWAMAERLTSVSA